MKAKKDNLLKLMSELERSLDERIAGREREWTQRVDRDLAELEGAVQRHAATLEPEDGRLIDVDRPRLPSPTVSRRAAGLHRELDGFLEETKALRTKVQSATLVFGGSVNPANLAGALPVAPEAGAIPDFGVFRERAQDLLRSLEHYEEEEAGLILESVNTDIGAGD